jgi:hypothetical protein
MKSWKTTFSGIAALLIAIINIAESVINSKPIDWTASMTAIMAGIGLIAAKDSNVTGGTIK